MSSISRRLLLALLAACASTVLASAQASSSPTEIEATVQSNTSPVAYVYVSNSPSSGKNQINGYAAAANGALTPISGSPFSTPAFYMAVNGSWLFATDGNNIDSFSIASNGALKQVDSLAVEKDGGLVNLYLDHTGTSLYAEYYTTNNDYLSYSIDNTTGKLAFINDLAGGPENNSAVSFVGNNEFAYSSSCYHFSPEIYGVQRATDGALSYLLFHPAFPHAALRRLLVPVAGSGRSYKSSRHRNATTERKLGNPGSVPACELHGGWNRKPDDYQHLRDHAESSG